MSRIANKTLIIGALLLAACQHASWFDTERPGADASVNRTGELTVSLELSGNALSPATSGPAAVEAAEVRLISVKEATRRIDPGDIPDSGWLGQVQPLAPGIWQVSQVPREQYVLLEVEFTSSVDLATGQPYPTGRSQPVAAHVPLWIDGDSRPSYALAIDLTAPATGGCLMRTRVAREDLAATEWTSRLNWAAGAVARDNDDDGDFTDETPLADPARLGVSRQLLTKLDRLNELAVLPAHAVCPATLTAVDLAAGELRVTGLVAPGLAGPDPAAESVISFAEDAGFVQRLITLQAETLASLPIQDWVPGAALTLTLANVAEAGTQPAYWLAQADTLELDLPADSIAAVPLKTTARPGEPVPVTVYANRTSFPLHAVKRLRVSFDADNLYRPGSFDPGDRTRGVQLADGAWAELGSTAFILPPANKLTTTALSDERSYIDFALEPQGASTLTSATGALCNFELICHREAQLAVERVAADGAATFYVDSQGHPAQWSVYGAATAPQVAVSGQPVVLKLVNPPVQQVSGNGPQWYLGTPGATYQLQLLDPLIGDVTFAPTADYYITCNSGATPPVELGAFTVPPAFRGPLYIVASYNGIFCSPASAIDMFVDDTESFSLDVYERESYIFGGTAQSLSLDFAPVPTGLAVQIMAQGAQDIHALYLAMTYDPQLYRPMGYTLPDQFNRLPGTLTLPYSFLTWDDPLGRLENGFCQVRPQANPGFSGTGLLFEIIFERQRIFTERANFNNQVDVPHLPELPCALLTTSATPAALRWFSYLSGDFNQDGIVHFTTGDRAPYGDLTVLAMHFDESSTGPDELAGVIDRRWDEAAQDFTGNGVVDISDIFPVLAFNSQQVDAWQVYYAPDMAEYPAGGSLVHTARFAAYNGDPATERIWYSWEPAGGIEPGYYWVKPVLNVKAGVASPVLAVPATE